MLGITLKNGLISYYGNPAGYTEKEKAVVDSIFQNDELTAWLKSRSLTPQWTDGVMERLAAGERMGGMNESAAPLKNVRVWQLKPETDVYRKFISYEETVRQFGEPSREHYRVAYGAVFVPRLSCRNHFKNFRRNCLMKKIHISRKKALVAAGIAAVTLAAALIPKAVKAVKHRRYSSSF